MKKKIMALLMAMIMVISSLPGMTVKAAGFQAADVYTPSPEEAIQDPVLHWAVRSAMNSVNLNGQKLTKEMVGSSAVRDISFAQCANPDNFLNNEAWKGKQFWIESLEGLQYATSARMIEISFTNAVEGKRISDLTPLSNLTQLEILIMKQDGIDDISPISNLVNLTQLDLYDNKMITNVDAIAGMTKLKSLKLSNNAITNVDAISNLEALEWVAFHNNKVSSLPDLSKLTNVYFLDAENNCLTNSDVKQIAKMRGLTRLNLLENEEVTDYRPLAVLTKLTKETTFLDDEAKKEDLFAAIEVNKLFEYFNISKMSPEDLANVEDALTAYENLTDEQKTYIDSGKIAAAQSNKELVAAGQDPVNYPEYDTTQGSPEFKQIKISVVDKYGQPMEGVRFQKIHKSDGSVLQYFITDEKGRLVITHLPIDNIYGVIAVVPEGDYVTEPAEITYTVSWDKNTKTINGKKATGLEELKMVVTPADEYVDKTLLKEALAGVDVVEREYKYTKDSYKIYADALNTARKCLDNPDTTESEAADAVNALNNAIAGLTKRDVLTELKIKVTDINGNIFHRAFGFQIRIPRTDGEESWTEFTCPYSGTVYLKTSPEWTDGKEWEILASDEEPYEIEPFTVTIGVKDGQAYFKTVDGEPVDVDFEKMVSAVYVPEGAESKTAPDKRIVEEMIDSANEINLADYTETTADNLTKAIEAAETILEKTNAIQEEYNDVIEGILEAIEALAEAANKVWLEEELNIAKTSYTESYYTKASWTVFQELLAKAQTVYDDGDATQTQVDDAIADLKAASKDILVRKADNSKLEAKLTEAKSLEGDKYTQESFEGLLEAIEAAQEVYDNDESTKEQIEAQVKALEDAIKALEEKETPPVEVDYSCQQGVFKAKVADGNGNPVEGVTFEAVIDGTVEKTFESDANGIITYQIYGQNNHKVTYVRLADERYTTEDEHYFEASGAYDWLTFITAIDGQAYTEGIKLTYTVTEASGEILPPIVQNISVLTEDIKAPGEVEIQIELAPEGSQELSYAELIFCGDNFTDKMLYYWLEQSDFSGTDGIYVCKIKLGDNVPADTYRLNEIELYDCTDNTRNYVWNAEDEKLKDWAGGYEAEPLEMVVIEGNTDTDHDVPMLQEMFFDTVVSAGEKLEVTVKALDLSGIRDASIVFYNHRREEYLYLNDCEMTDLQNGTYKFTFEIHKYQYADTYELDSITLTDRSAYANSVKYWLDGSCLKDVYGREAAISTAKKYLTIEQKNPVRWTTTDTTAFYNAVMKAKDNENLVIIGGDSDGSQWILNKRPLGAARVRLLTLILPDLLTETEIIIDTASIPEVLPEEMYAGIKSSGFTNGYFDLELQMTNPDIPFQVKFKTKELENLSDRTFLLVKVEADGAETLLKTGLVVDKDGFLNIKFPGGIDSGEGFSHFRLRRNENTVCEGIHKGLRDISMQKASMEQDGHRITVCDFCGTVENQTFYHVEKITLASAKYIYDSTAKKPGITVKDTKGNTLKRGIDYQVTYASGRKNVGRYTVKVIFTGNYMGTATKYFTIVPAAVTNLSAIRYQYGNQARLTWTKSIGATGYRVYMKKNSASKYTYLGSTKNTYYVKGGLTKNTAYRFKVIPYYKTGTGATPYYSDQAYKTVLINTVVKGNKLVKVSGVRVAKSGTKVKVSWKNVSYETGYQISRSVSKTGTNIIATYKTASGKSKMVTAAKNKTYYYKVRAYRVVNDKKIYGAWSDPVKFTRK